MKYLIVFDHHLLNYFRVLFKYLEMPIWAVMKGTSCTVVTIIPSEVVNVLNIFIRAPSLLVLVKISKSVNAYFGHT